ncbi:MAG: hypothetical protein M3R63_21070, partial [Actinomycetota bacterium]|nr:hypothetical protein [Actinomycetota bacterium]
TAKAQRPAREAQTPAKRGGAGGATLADPPVVINAPLDFELKELQTGHPYLRDCGLLPKTIEHFGLGYCGRGMLQDRIAIPLHDAAGRLIGYAGRLIDERQVSAQNPKYKFPAPRLRNNRVLELRPELFLYNGWRIQKPIKDLIVVQGFESVWWLWQHGYPDVVSVMGSSCSEEQGELLVDLVDVHGTVWAFMDGSDNGRRCAASVLLTVGRYRSVRHVPLADGERSTDCSAEDLGALLAGSGQ